MGRGEGFLTVSKEIDRVRSCRMQTGDSIRVLSFVDGTSPLVSSSGFTNCMFSTEPDFFLAKIPREVGELLNEIVNGRKLALRPRLEDLFWKLDSSKLEFCLKKDFRRNPGDRGLLSGLFCLGDAAGSECVSERDSCCCNIIFSLERFDLFQ